VWVAWNQRVRAQEINDVFSQIDEYEKEHYGETFSEVDLVNFTVYSHYSHE
jgi:hypothetical protein